MPRAPFAVDIAAPQTEPQQPKDHMQQSHGQASFNRAADGGAAAAPTRYSHSPYAPLRFGVVAQLDAAFCAPPRASQRTSIDGASSASGSHDAADISGHDSGVCLTSSAVLSDVGAVSPREEPVLAALWPPVAAPLPAVSVATAAPVRALVFPPAATPVVPKPGSSNAAAAPVEHRPHRQHTSSVPRGVFHAALTGQCDFLHVPRGGVVGAVDGVVVAPELRLFFRQLRFETTAGELRWIVRETCGVEILKVEVRWPGSLVAYFSTKEDKAAVKALNKLLLFDNCGVWFARTAVQAVTLIAYGAHHGVRATRLPKEAVAIEEERGRTAAPPCLAASPLRL